MIKSMIYTDDKSTIVFCEGNKIYFKTPTGSYIESRDMIKQLDGHNFIRNKFKDKINEINKLLSLDDYKVAAKFYFNTNKARGRDGKLFEGEFNELQ